MYHQKQQNSMINRNSTRSLPQPSLSPPPNLSRAGINYRMSKEEDNIPLALLAYKKGYTTVYPASYSSFPSLNSHSSGSSSHHKPLPHFNNKKEEHRHKNNKQVKQTHHHHHKNKKESLPPSQSPAKKKKRTTTITTIQHQEIKPIIKEKKWYSSLRRLIK